MPSTCIKLRFLKKCELDWSNLPSKFKSWAGKFFSRIWGSNPCRGGWNFLTFFFFFTFFLFSTNNWILKHKRFHTGRNCFNLFQISFSANTADTDPEVSMVSKDQKFCVKFKNTHCQAHWLYRFLEGQKTSHFSFSVPGLWGNHRNLRQEKKFNSREGFFRKSPFCTFYCINPWFGGPWCML